MNTFFFWSSPNFGQKIGPILSEDLLFFFGLHLILRTFLSEDQKTSRPILSEDILLIYLFALQVILGARHRSSYPLEKFLSEALPMIMLFNSWVVTCTVDRGSIVPCLMFTPLRYSMQNQYAVCILPLNNTSVMPPSFFWK